MITELHQSGQLDCSGQMWTWVAGEAQAVPLVNALIGMVGIYPYLDGKIGLRARLEGEVGIVDYVNGSGAE